MVRWRAQVWRQRAGGQAGGVAAAAEGATDQHVVSHGAVQQPGALRHEGDAAGGAAGAQRRAAAALRLAQEAVQELRIGIGIRIRIRIRIGI